MPRGELEALEVARKKRVILEGRLRKESYASLSDRLGVAISTCRLWAKEMTVTMLPQEELEELRAMEVAGYDASESDLWLLIDMAKREGAKAELEERSTVAIREQIARLHSQIGDVRRARALLLGLNAPVMVQHKHTVRTGFDAEVESLVSDLLGGGILQTGPDVVDTGTDG